MRLLTLILTAMLDIVPGGPAYMKQLQPRDSILIADQIEYGVLLNDVKEGTGLNMADFESVLPKDTLSLVRGWQIDTLKSSSIKKKNPAPRLFNLRASVVLAPFEEGHYVLPPIPVERTVDGKVDTLYFDPVELDVKTMPVDTATFEIHDIKGQMRYPLTFAELAPWLAAAWLLAVLVILTWALVSMRRGKASDAPAVQEPAYITALRKLERFRGDKFWAPEKQKMFYSGITDTLKNYIDDRFGVDAPEMTTAELFDALKDNRDLTPELYSELKELFERADFVKFAKYTAPDEDNAKALPLAVRFVTSTYQSEIEEENVL